MPTPLIGNVHADTYMTNVIVAAMQDSDEFVASKVFPSVGADKQTGYYFKVNSGDMNRDNLPLRGEGSKFDRGGFRVSSGSYTCREYAREFAIPLEVLANQDTPMDVKKGAAHQLAQQILIKRERLMASTFLATSVWTTETTPSNLWSDYVNSTPLVDIQTGVSTFRKNNHQSPNVAVCGAEVWDKLKNHPNITDRIKHSQIGLTTEELFAQLIGVKEFYVSRGSYESAIEGATSSPSYIVGKHFGLFRKAPGATLWDQQSGMFVNWRSAGHNDEGVLVENYEEKQTRSEIQRASLYTTPEQVDAALGYFFLSCVA